MGSPFWHKICKNRGAENAHTYYCAHVRYIQSPTVTIDSKMTPKLIHNGFQHRRCWYNFWHMFVFWLAICFWLWFPRVRHPYKKITLGGQFWVPKWHSGGSGKDPLKPHPWSLRWTLSGKSPSGLGYQPPRLFGNRVPAAPRDPCSICATQTCYQDLGSSY